MSNIGWIKLHRKILTWELYRDANAFRVYMHFLLNAYYEKTKWGQHEFEPGDYSFTYDALAGSLGLTVRQIRLAIEKLKKSQNIVSKMSGRFQVISIVKYNLFKDIENTNVSEMSSSCQKNVSKVSTLKEDNNIINNNLKNNNSNELLQKDRGSRLDVNLKLSPQWREYAVSRGLNDPDTEFERFKNYWTSPNAKKPMKKDWLATWRNWVLKISHTPRNSFADYRSNENNPYDGMTTEEILAAKGIIL
ncbi:MAG: hypothetical protein R3Y43_04140 [Alphaproteobacteria bacterium]